MKAELVYYEKRYLSENTLQEVKIWKVPKVADKPHGYKYSFVYIVNGERVIGYDNYEKKGDHKHYRGKEFSYEFVSIEKVWEDFKNDIERFKEGKL